MRTILASSPPPISASSGASNAAKPSISKNCSHRPLHADPALKAGVTTLSQAHRDFAERYQLRSHGYLASGEGSEGISHPMMAEHYALPGQVIAGTDSHTPHIGAVGCLAFGVGTTDMANAMVTGAVRITVPEGLRVELA